MNKAEKLESEYSDLGLATAISLLLYPPKDIRPVNERRSVFVFDWHADLSKIEQGYFSGKLNVSALLYFQHIKVMKNRLYGGRKL